jgi:acetyl esterase/lipase
LSANIHPSQQKMTQDAESAWRYLTRTSGIAPGNIIPYGTGVGASLATQLALNHPETPAVILDSPYTDLLEVARHDPRTSLVPLRLLFHQDFPLAAPLATLRTPKLLITTVNKPSAAFRTAATPKMTVERKLTPDSQYQEAIVRFLDQYLPHSPPPLVPTRARSATNSR